MKKEIVLFVLMFPLMSFAKAVPELGSLINKNSAEEKQIHQNIESAVTPNREPASFIIEGPIKIIPEAEFSPITDPNMLRFQRELVPDAQVDEVSTQQRIEKEFVGLD